MQADLAQLKEELRTAEAERKAKLQQRVDRLQAAIDDQQQKAQSWFAAFQARRKAKRGSYRVDAISLGFPGSTHPPALAASPAPSDGPQLPGS